MAEETTHPETAGPDPAILVELTSEVVAAYLAHNHVTTADMPALIHSVHDALSGLGQPATAAPEPSKPVPRMPIRKTITDEHIVSLEDGKPYRTLKRHLGRLGLTPDAYREKWGLPSDYPMVAPSYSRARSAMAKDLGLGALRRKG